MILTLLRHRFVSNLNLNKENLAFKELASQINIIFYTFQKVESRDVIFSRVKL
jgi:hypothetical protein